MSLPDLTNIPTSHHGNDCRAQATTPAPTHPDTASYEQQLTPLNELIRRTTPLSEIEQWIDRTPLTDDEEKAALWLYAWSLTDIAGQRAARRTYQSARLPAVSRPSGRRLRGTLSLVPKQASPGG